MAAITAMNARGKEQRGGCAELGMGCVLPSGNFLKSLMLSVFLSAATSPAWAQSVEQFYHGKTIDLIVGFAAGGGNDLYVRSFGRYVGKYIPGNPAVVTRNMPGAGTFLATNAVYNTLKRDGTVMALGASTLPLDEKFGAGGVRFKTAELNWIGRLATRVDVVMMWKTARVKNIQDATRYPSILAATTVGSPVVMYPNLLNNVIGTKFKIVRGYQGSREAMLAVEKGEAEGHSTGWESLMNAHPDWVKNKDVNIIVQFSLQRHPDLPDVPAAVELGRTPDETQILKTVMNTTEIGLAIFSTPGVPAERLTALRRAFDATAVDPDFLAEVKNAGISISPLPGERLQNLVSEVADLSPDLTAKAKAAYLHVQ
jgi:tripartite-type tricarboxylate transporter receptor subunit TctC